MKKIKFDKNTILIILLIITFILLFSTYIYSLVKKEHLRKNGEKELAEEKEILTAEEDPMYSSYCRGKIDYVVNKQIKKGNLGYTQELIITLTNESDKPYNSWTIKIPANDVLVEKIDGGSYYYNNAAFLNSLGSFEGLEPGKSVVIEATINTPKKNINDNFKYMVLTDCEAKRSNIISNGNAKLSLGELEVELKPELRLEKVENDETTYALYLNNANTVATKNTRLVLYYEYGEFVSLSDFNVTNNKNEKTVTAIDIDEIESMINRGYNSRKYTLVLKNVPLDYKPDIVAAGTKIE